jgi:hypothetical protein
VILFRRMAIRASAWEAMLRGVLLVAAVGGERSGCSAPPPSSAEARREERTPKSGDRSSNEGAQGRINATEEAARAAEPQVPIRLP